MKNPIIIKDGKASWISKTDDQYVATGIERNGRRFKIVSKSWSHINGINMWRGTKWLLRDGNRFKIISIKN